MARADLPLHTDACVTLIWIDILKCLKLAVMGWRLDSFDAASSVSKNQAAPGLCTYSTYMSINCASIGARGTAEWRETVQLHSARPAQFLLHDVSTWIQAFYDFQTLYTPADSFFLVQTLRMKKTFLEVLIRNELFLHRMRICCKKNDPFNSQINVDIPELSNCKHLEQSQWLCRMDITSPKTEHPRTSDYEIFLPLWSPCQISGIKKLLVWPWPAIIQDVACVWTLTTSVNAGDVTLGSHVGHDQVV